MLISVDVSSEASRVTVASSTISSSAAAVAQADDADVHQSSSLSDEDQQMVNRLDITYF